MAKENSSKSRTPLLGDRRLGDEYFFALEVGLGCFDRWDGPTSTR